MRAADLTRVRDGSRVGTAGLVLVRQRPGSAKGVLFLTLEDETGPANVIVWPTLFERNRRVVLSAGMMGVEGRLQREGGVEHVIAERLVDLSAALARVGERDAPAPTGYGEAGAAPERRGLRDPSPAVVFRARDGRTTGGSAVVPDERRPSMAEPSSDGMRRRSRKGPAGDEVRVAFPLTPVCLRVSG